MTPIHCEECGRANADTAKKCLWCGFPIFKGDAAGAIEKTRVEIGYLDGITRFEDPASVRLTISNEGVEVAEVLPGTRSFKIPASSIIEANWADASTVNEQPQVRQKRRWFSRAKSPEVKVHDYILAIKYKDGDETRTAVFHRQDRDGLAVIERLARIVRSLIRRHGERGET